MTIEYVAVSQRSTLQLQRDEGLLVDTLCVEPQERFPLWVSAANELYGELAYQRSNEAPFHGQIRAHSVGPLKFVRTEADPITAFRPARTLSGFNVKLNLYGGCRTGIAGKEITLRPGELVLYEEQALDYVDCQSGGPWGELDVHLPWALVRPYAERMRSVAGVALSGTTGIGGLLFRFLDDIDATLTREVARSDDLHLANSAFELLLALCGQEETGGVTRSAGAHQHLLSQIKNYIEEHLSDSGLEPTMIARDNFISTRLLYKLFEREGVSVGRWIRTRRLDRCRQDLHDPHFRDDTIAQIADRWGFTSPAHFSRLFRSCVGETPSDYRRTRTPRTSTGV